jgi:hypothetical protein
LNGVDPFRRAVAIAQIFILRIVDGCKKEHIAPNAQLSSQNQQANPQQQQPRCMPKLCDLHRHCVELSRE